MDAGKDCEVAPAPKLLTEAWTKILAKQKILRPVQRLEHGGRTEATEILDPPYFRKIGLAVKDKKRLSPVTEKFLGYLKYGAR